MQSQWKDADAQAAVDQYAAKGINEDLALRTYTTRLLGRDPRLVLHGGGNTSVKTTVKDTFGADVPVLCVKGSGWDMAVIEPQGLPAVRMDVLTKLGTLNRLSDEDMVNVQRGALLDSTSPNPSIETLLHAFLPHKFIDHTHANAVLALSDQPNGEEMCRKVYGDRVVLVPYVMPGFDLAKKAAAMFATNPKAEGMVLLKHGIFSFGDTAKEAYERMIRLVTEAEEAVAKIGRKKFAPARLPAKIASAADVAPILRGLVADLVDDNEGLWKRLVFDLRSGPDVMNFVNGAEIARYSQQGVPTPDHTIRTKNWPMVVPAPEAGQLEAFKAGAKAALDEFVARYHAYFARHNGKRSGPKKELDAFPRVILVPGLGAFGLGKSKKDARIAADLMDCTAEVVADAEALGTFNPVTEADLFDVEYWSLEQAKLGKEAEKPLARQVAIVTGGGSGIGAATAKAFAAQGAEVAVLDLNADAAKKVAKEIGSTVIGLGCDVTKPDDVRRAFDAVCAEFGGVDIVVSNAGAAFQGRIGDVADEQLRKSFELNFFSHQTVAQNAIRVMRAQGLGGNLLFNTSKQAVNPGPDFGPYGLPKAALLFLTRQYALDHGAEGIRANAVNADRINTGIFADGMLESRAKARNQTVEQYLREGNLLRREVKAADVAQAFVDLALARKTTGSVTTVDGGNIAAALR